MGEPLTPAQLDSMRILQAGDEATIKLSELKRAYDAANPPMAARTLAQEVATAIDEVMGRTNQRSTLGQYLRPGNTGGELRKHQIAVAREWERQLLKDPEQIRRVEADDPDMRSKRLLSERRAARALTAPEPPGTGLDVHQKPRPRSGPSLRVPGRQSQAGGLDRHPL